MVSNAGTDAHINVGRAWTTLQGALSTWTVNKVNNINNLAAAIRKLRG